MLGKKEGQGKVILENDTKRTSITFIVIAVFVLISVGLVFISNI